MYMGAVNIPRRLTNSVTKPSKRHIAASSKLLRCQRYGSGLPPGVRLQYCTLTLHTQHEEEGGKHKSGLSRAAKGRQDDIFKTKEQKKKERGVDLPLPSKAHSPNL
jgi:hypothetical protein